MSKVVRRTTNRSSGPTRPSCLVRTRTLIASTTSGPFAPSRTVIRSQRDFGWLAAQVSTRTNGTSRLRPTPAFLRGGRRRSRSRTVVLHGTSRTERSPR